MTQAAETNQQPSPELFFETMLAYQRTAALKAAIELDLFTAIGEGAHTSEALAQRCQTSERGMRILCDYLVVIGFRNPEPLEFMSRQTTILTDFSVSRYKSLSTFLPIDADVNVTSCL